MPDQPIPPLLPDQLPHIFVEVAFNLLPEINYDDLVYLSTIVKEIKQEPLYAPLLDSLRKIQWAKISAFDAINVEVVLRQAYVENIIIHDPVGQIVHAKSIMEFVSHSKAALDSIAVFLNDFLDLGFQGGQRDFRQGLFKTKLQSSNNVIGTFIQAESKWLEINSSGSGSIIAVRDEWLHRGSPEIVLMWPPTEVGALPIPRTILQTLLDNTNASQATHFSTQEFIEFHFSKLVRLFHTIVQQCIEIQVTKLPKPPVRPPAAKNPVSYVKVRLTERIAVTPESLKLGPFTQMALGKKNERT